MSDQNKVELYARGSRFERGGPGLLDNRVVDVSDSYEIVEPRSEEHTSELQSQSNLVCRLLLEKKKTQHPRITSVQRPSTSTKPHHQLTEPHLTQSHLPHLTGASHHPRYHTRASRGHRLTPVRL